MMSIPLPDEFIDLSQVQLEGTYPEGLLRLLVLAFILGLYIHWMSKGEWSQLVWADWLIIVLALTGIGLPFLLGQLGFVTFVLCSAGFVLCAKRLAVWFSQPWD